ncbi:hypothetical protein CAJAP_03012 [Camponotus japonicus]
MAESRVAHFGWSAENHQLPRSAVKIACPTGACRRAAPNRGARTSIWLKGALSTSATLQGSLPERAS